MTRRPGSLLIDVLAALTLLGSTTVALVLAHARAVEQFTATQRQARASEIADALIATWRLERMDVRTETSGVMENDADWSWRRSAEPVMVADDMDMLQINLDIAFESAEGSEVVSTIHWLESPDEPEREGRRR